MNEAYICDAIRTPIGRYGGALSAVRTDDLGAIPIRALMQRNPNVDWDRVDDVIFGCANQAGEDNRNVARMSSLLAGLPDERTGSDRQPPVRFGHGRGRQCGARDQERRGRLMLAGGVESMSRAPFVMPKARQRLQPQQRSLRHHHRLALRQSGDEGTLRYRFDAGNRRERGCRFQYRTRRAGSHGAAFAAKGRRGATVGLLCRRNHPGQRTADARAIRSSSRRTNIRAKPRSRSSPHCKPIVRADGTVTAGNASGVNDGACALLLADETTAEQFKLTPRARVIGMATAGVAPRIMGFGPAPASRKVLEQTGLGLEQMDVIELNEAFAAQGLAVLRDLGLDDDDARVNPNGGAIALGHPLGASGARLITTAINQLHAGGGRYALCTMCIGVGQGIATIIERV